MRIRFPRYLPSSGLVTPYNNKESYGNKLLQELEKGKYAKTDIYTYHTAIIVGKEILLLTDKRLAYIIHNDMFNSWQVCI